MINSTNLVEIESSLERIETFLRDEALQIVSSATHFEPQRDYAVLISEIVRLQGFGFFFNESQKERLDKLVDSLQKKINEFVDVLRQVAALPNPERERLYPQAAHAFHQVRAEYILNRKLFWDSLKSNSAVENNTPHHQAGSPHLFICYRRSDSNWVVDRIFRGLRNAGLNPFRDLDSIPLGVSFPQFIHDALQDVEIVLPIIGPSWGNCLDENGNRRIDMDGDHVRTEIEIALSLNKTIVPVLLYPTTMHRVGPLPLSIHALATINSFALRPDPDFDNDIEKLVRAVRIACANQPR